MTLLTGTRLAGETSLKYYNIVLLFNYPTFIFLTKIYVFFFSFLIVSEMEIVT